MQSIELTDKEALMFLAWRGHQETFDIILNSGILDLREASAEIHFDPQGKVGSIKVNGPVYKRDPLASVIVIHTPVR